MFLIFVFGFSHMFIISHVLSFQKSTSDIHHLDGALQSHVVGGQQVRDAQHPTATAASQAELFFRLPMLGK